MFVVEKKFEIISLSGSISQKRSYVRKCKNRNTLLVNIGLNIVFIVIKDSRQFYDTPVISF